MKTVAEMTIGAPDAVISVLRGLEARDMGLMLEGFTPDARWTLVGKPPRFPLGGTKTATQVAEMLSGALPGFHKFEFELLAWAKNGDTVFIEALTRAVGPGQAVYNNRYLMRFTLQDGRVKELLEHYDPFAALDYLEQVEAGV